MSLLVPKMSASPWRRALGQHRDQERRAANSREMTRLHHLKRASMALPTQQSCGHTPAPWALLHVQHVDAGPGKIQAHRGLLRKSSWITVPLHLAMPSVPGLSICRTAMAYQ